MNIGSCVLSPASTSCPSSRGFSLVELIVVIGIIGILAGVLLASFSGSTESARSAICLANMRNLATACQTYGVEDKHYPCAGGLECMYVDESDKLDPKVRYNEYKSWISWNSGNAYKGRALPTSHQSSGAWMVSTYTDNKETGIFCLTNGALWKYVSGTRATYVCPSHAKKMKKTPPWWSYLMSSRFSWDYTKGSDTTGDLRIEYGTLDDADKVLLFGEIPFAGIGSWQPEGTGSGTDCDCVLQYDGSLVKDKRLMVQGKENIGANHINGRNLFAHVAFADGHTEKLRIPYTGSIKAPVVDDTQLRNLTSWLCAGQDVSFDGKTYKSLTND